MLTAAPHIRLPLAARVVTVLYLVGWALRLVWFAVDAPTGADLVAYPLMALLALTVGFRVLRLGVDGEGDLLVVRNISRTRTFSRTAVAGFRVGRPPWQPVGVTCIALLGGNGDSYPLDGTVALGPFRRRTTADLDRLRAWLAAG